MKNSEPLIVQIATVDVMLRALLPQMLSMRARGYRVAAVSSPGPTLAEIEQAGISVATIAMTRRVTPFSDFISLVRLISWMRRNKPDVVHSHTPKANLLAPWAAWFAGVPCRVVTIHGLFFRKGMPTGARIFHVVREFLSCLPAHLVYVLNRDDLRVLSWFKGRNKLRMLPCGLGVDLERFSQKWSDEERSDLRKQLGFEEGEFVVGFVGRLVREKGLGELFTAIAALAPRYPRLKLLVIGPDEPEKADRVSPTDAANVGIMSRCVFTGRRDDVDRLYALMDVFVLPSWREGLGLAIAEAQASGVPVIASATGGGTHLITDRITGLIVPIGDAFALEKAIEEIVLNPALGLKLAAAAVRSVRANGDQAGAAKLVIDDYDRLVAGRSRRSGSPGDRC